MDGSCRVLIIEDEGLLAADLERRVRSLGHHVVGLGSSSGDAVVLAGSLRPDVVLLDIRLQGPGSGIEAAETIRQLGIPVVFLTAYADPETIHSAKLTLPYGYLVKPVRDSELIAAIAIACEQQTVANHTHKSEAWIDALMRGVREPVLTLGPEGRIKGLNGAACDWLGAPKDLVLGRPLYDVIHAPADVIAETMLSENFLFRTTASIRGAAGCRPSADCTCVMAHSDGTTDGMVIILHVTNSTAHSCPA